MIFVIFSLLAASGFAIANIIDKVVIDKYFGDSSLNTLSSIAGIIGLPFLSILFVIYGKLPSNDAFVAGTATGILALLSYRIYYSSLQKNDAALVTVLYQMILPANLILGWIFLKEQPGLIQSVGALLVIAASILMSLENREEKWKIDKRLFFTMLVASTLISSGDVIFKRIASQESFFPVAIAEYTATVVVGILIFTFSKRVRKDIKKFREQGITSLISVMGLNEAVVLTATLSMRYALVIGSIFLTQAIMGIQPIFVFLLGITFAYFLPKLHEMDGYKRHWRLKVLAIGLSVIGAILIG